MIKFRAVTQKRTSSIWTYVSSEEDRKDMELRKSRWKFFSRYNQSFHSNKTDWKSEKNTLLLCQIKFVIRNFFLTFEVKDFWMSFCFQLNRFKLRMLWKTMKCVWKKLKLTGFLPLEVISILAGNLFPFYLWFFSDPKYNPLNESFQIFK